MPNQNNIYVVGANGQLGEEIRHLSAELAGYQFFFYGHQDLNIANADDVQKLSPKVNDIIINAAAYTAVDRAEEDKVSANNANHIGPRNLAELAKKTGCLLIHISTDYVFDGQKTGSYSENDTTNPLSVYGETKLKGEEAVLQSEARALIIRTSWVYSSFGNNFVKTMLRLGKDRDNISVIFEQTGSPTFAGDLASAIVEIIQNLPSTLTFPQIYHYSNEGAISWFDFSKTIMELSDTSCQVNPIEIKDYPLPAVRPVNSVLNKGKIKKDFGITIPYWKDSLRSCLKQIDKELL